MKLNADRTTATLAINADLKAHEVEELIRALAMLRADMAPQVEPHITRPDGSRTPAIEQDAPTLAINVPNGSSPILRLRSIGLGWTAWALRKEDWAAVGEFIDAYRTASPTGDKQSH